LLLVISRRLLAIAWLQSQRHQQQRWQEHGIITSSNCELHRGFSPLGGGKAAAYAGVAVGLRVNRNNYDGENKCKPLTEGLIFFLFN